MWACPAETSCLSAPWKGETETEAEEPDKEISKNQDNEKQYCPEEKPDLPPDKE